ncbi:MAG: hypothetical protein ACKVU4_15210 [Phycisphaerales bacterium]
MPSEASRALVRIGSNYARLLVTMAMGLALVPLQLEIFGEDGFGLISVVTTSIGLAALLQDVCERSLVREMGAAHHAGDDGAFRAVCDAAWLVALASAAITAALFVVVLLCVPWLVDDRPDLVPAAQALVGAEALLGLLSILILPAQVMYSVTERFVLYNAFVALQRTGYLVPALLIWWLGPGPGTVEGAPAQGGTLVTYALGCVAMHTVTLLIPAGLMLAMDRRLMPRPWRARRAVLRKVVGNFGWNSAVVFALGSHERTTALIGNLAMAPAGLVWNAVYAVGLRGCAIVRMATYGMTVGLDAVSTRVTTHHDPAERLRWLVGHASRLHAFTAVPGGITFFMLTEPIIELWIGRSLEDPAATIPQAAVMVRVLIVASVVRSVVDGWIAILYGAGHIRSVVRLALAGAVLTPVAALLLLAVLPRDLRLYAPAIAFGAVFTVVHGVVLPPVAARRLGVRLSDLWAPMIRPAIVSFACAPIYAGALVLIERWTLLHLIGVLAAYGAAYALLSWLFVVTPQERSRLIAAARRRLPRGSDPQPPGLDLGATTSSTSTGV